MAPSTKFFLFTVIVIPLFLLPFCCGCLHREREALLRFKAALHYSTDYLDLTSSEKGGDCCLWDGISCHNTTHHIVAVDINGYGRYGERRGGVISESLCALTSLATLRVSRMDLTGTPPACLGNLSSLRQLDLSYNMLSANIPLSSSRAFSDLSYNNLQSETILGIICLLSNLNEVDLSYNNLNGSLPYCLGNLSSLHKMDISENHLSGTIPESLGNLFFLKSLDLSDNQLTGSIPDSLGNLSLLEELYLSDNQLSGSIPNSLGNLFLLQDLLLSDNRLNGTLPSFSRLSSLRWLYVDGNEVSSLSSALPSSLNDVYLSLDGHQIISEDFFHNLTKLNSLWLSNCVLNISTNWIPLFQLSELYISSCKMDGQIPSWISTQFFLRSLELTNNNLVGEIPSWLLDMGIQYINLSANHLEGGLLLNTSDSNLLAVLDVSRNALSGQLPPIWPPGIEALMLDNNLLTGDIPRNLLAVSSIKVLNLASNHLNGIIPPSLGNCSSLQMLKLGNNNLRGMIPHELSNLYYLKSLLVENNKLSGSFPPSISNCTNLHFLDVGQNFLKGYIPKSIGNLTELKVLAMRKNNFEGSIPKEIGQLKNLQILDLSSNQLSGFVPDSIFSLQAMSEEIHQEFSRDQLQINTQFTMMYYIYKNGLTMNSKGRDENYTYIFPTMAAIDLSNNQLIGDLPFDLGKLKGLKLLNLSMNNFSGVIPNSIVQLNWLETLDFSTNHFSGQIPPDLGSMNYLEALNFSRNHLSGSIPQGGHMATFTESSYSHNPNLWGCPLPKKCSWHEFACTPPISTSADVEEQSEESVGYDIGVGLSYVAGFTTVLVFIVLKNKYFETVDMILKIIFPWIRNLTL